MSVKTSKNKRIKFGLFKTEKAALEECSKREKMMPKLVKHGASFRTLKVQRNKEGQRSWLAYCLVKKKGR